MQAVSDSFFMSNHAVEVQFNFLINNSAETLDDTVGFVIRFPLSFDVIH